MQNPLFGTRAFFLTLLGAIIGLGGFFLVFYAAYAAEPFISAPTRIVQGPQYGGAGVQWNFGRMFSWTPGWEQYYPEGGWRDQISQSRKMVYVKTNATPAEEFLVVGYLDGNNCQSASSCQLRFKVSSNKGMTWNEAISGVTKSVTVQKRELPDMTGGSGQHISFFTSEYNALDFTMYASLNTVHPDIWISYTSGTSSSMYYSALGAAVQRKLEYQGNGQWKIETVVYHPSTAGEGRYGAAFPQFTHVAVANQWFGDSEEIYGVVEFLEMDYCTIRTAMVECNLKTSSGKCTNYADWQISATIFNGTRCGGGASHYSPIMNGRSVFVPLVDPSNNTIGKPGPALIHVWPKLYIKDTLTYEIPSGTGEDINGDAGTRIWVNGQQLAYVNLYPISSKCSGAPCPSLVKMNFSAAAYQEDASNSSLMIAWEGGATWDLFTGSDNHEGKISTALLNLGISGSTVSLIGAPNVKIDNVTGGHSWRNPNVTYAPRVNPPVYSGMQAWLTMLDSNLYHFFVLEEDASTGHTNSWKAPVEYQGGAGLNGIASVGSVAAIANVPYDAANPFISNSLLPPFVWSEPYWGLPYREAQIRFPANSSGNFLGYGWSSNFGWLSLNCANLGLPLPTCNKPYGIDVMSPPDDINTSPFNKPGVSDFSPAGYPLSGFAWSSNAGWLTFDRAYSVCSSASGCVPDTNPYGNPPGQAYHLSTDAADPIVKYDPNTQLIYGWGRFLNKCNISTEGRCQNADGGWVRMSGYWDKCKWQTTPTVGCSGGGVASTLAAPYNNSGTIQLVSSAGFLNPGGTKFAVVRIGNEFFKYTQVSGNNLTGVTTSSKFAPIAAGAPVIAVSGIDGVTDLNIGGPYGVNSYWVGNNYEPWGWAWSDDYGWIRFMPQSYVGMAWLETLFGNIYSSGNINLPGPQYASGEQISTCGIGKDQPCYVATYRIETTGSIDPVQAPSGQSAGSANSAMNYIGHLLPATGDGLENYLTRGSTGSTANFGFPTVNPDSVTYSNALGKVDVGALKTFVGDNIDQGLCDPPCSGFTYKFGQNRLAQELIETQLNGTTPQAWPVSKLANFSGIGNYTWSSVPPTYKGALETLRNQIVHVKGDLTVDGRYGTLNTALSGTYTEIIINGGSGFGGNMPSFPTKGTLVIDEGVIGSEEYVNYTGTGYVSFKGPSFTGVQHISGATTGHAVGASVRWVWQLPYTSGYTKAQNVTVIVDGDLKIDYNIIAQTVASPTSISDVPTIAFIVYGNVIIDKSVNKVTGAFIVIGRDSTKEPGAVCSDNSGDPNYCSGHSDWGGAFITGDDSTSYNPLTITGLLFARKFEFQRLGSNDLTIPGESVSSDPNLFLNPPPGLEDATKLLPKIQRVGQ